MVFPAKTIFIPTLKLLLKLKQNALTIKAILRLQSEVGYKRKRTKFYNFQYLPVFFLVEPLLVDLSEVEHVDVRLVHGTDVSHPGIHLDGLRPVYTRHRNTVAGLNGIDQIVVGE